MEREGIPIDVLTYLDVVENWEALKVELVEQIDANLGVYEGTTFRTARFQKLLADYEVYNWPTTELTGRLALDDDTFLEQIALRPALAFLLTDLRELRATLHRLRQLAVLRRLGVKETVHGMRSSLRTWAADTAPEYAREVAEACLGHFAGGVEGIYNRADFIELRRGLLEKWAGFCGAPQTANVVPLRRTA
jgi:hypothetical protein